MKTKITLLVLTALLGLTNVFANSMPTSENVVENEIMTTGDNSIIISAGKRIYTLDMNTYQATLLATSPYVNEINSIASDNTTGWIFYVSNHISRYNWTIYGYNVYTNTHKNFGSVRHFFTPTGHAYSSRGLGSGGATFYNGKLYFAMEYPVNCYYYKGETSGNANPKDELPNNVRAAGTVSNSMFTRGGRTNTTMNNSSREDETVDDGGRTGNGETPDDFVVIDGDEANALNDLVSDYIPEEDLPADENDDGLAQRGDSNTESYNYHSSSYNNYMYLLEISFSGLSDASGGTAAVSNGSPVYDRWGYSSFLYRGELGDIAVDDNGQLYAATSYQVQAYNFNTRRYDWANNEDVYAQMAKDKHSALQLLKNKRQCSTSYYYGCPHTTCTTKSFVQGYTAPSNLRTYNNIHLGGLNEITGLQSNDVGKITDASDYVRLTPPVSYKIEGFVFDDNNEDGNLDTGETKLDGVAVTLYADTNGDGALDAGDTVIESKNTDATGNYAFNNVEVQKTLVKVTAPTDDNDFTYTLTTAEVVSVTGATSDITGIKFGINKQPVVVNVAYDVFGTVYDDDNENATLEAGENGLDNVTLTLYADVNADGALDAGDTVITTTTSGTDGSYSFLHVCIQNTLVTVTVPTSTGNFTYTLTTPGTQAIDSINTNVTGVDFGINEEQIINYNLSGTVFDDDNANGTFETGEGTLESVTVTLYADNNNDDALDAGDTVITSANTAITGVYNFTAVTVENTVVAVTVPTDTGDFTYTLTTAGTLAASSTTTDVTGLDFGINKVQIIDYNVSGNVYDDNDESGAQDAGEDNLESVTVTLYADNNADGVVDAGDTVITSAPSAVDGTYSFSNVTVQNTVVAVTVPTNTADFTYTLTTAGVQDTSSTTTDVAGINFGINEVQIIDYNISGTVFDDNNENGTQDAGEDNLDTITVTLYDDANANGVVDAGEAVISSAISGVDGTYNFANVTVPNTVVTVTVPSNTANFTYTLTTAGEVNTSSTTADVANVNFGINEVQVIDFNISGTVFDDNNENGTQDAGDGVLDAITLTLYADNNADGVLDVADTTLSSTTTATDGTYGFSNITSSNVLVVVSTPGNTAVFTYALTTANTQAVTSLITDVTGVDFGINEVEVIDFNISGTVYDDDNANGAIDASETGRLDNVTMMLYSDNNTDGVLDAGDTMITSTTTSVDGTYAFSNVANKNTLVMVDVPTNTATFTYTATTSELVAVTSTIADVTDVDYGVNVEEIINYNVSGTVFDDDNENGAKDVSEGFLEGLTITLYADNNADGVLDVADTTLTSTITDLKGDYSFSNVTAPNVLTVVTTPGNTATFTYVLTTSNTQAASSTTTDVIELDFGINEVKVINYNISGNVFDDNNGDGIKGMGEGPVGPVTVTLYADTNNDGILDAGDTVITTTVTNTMSGNFNFTNVTVENTITVVTVPTDTATFTYTLTTAGTQDTTSTLTDVTGVNFGIDRAQVINYNISGTVFDDDNANGVNDAEAGLDNVTVTLYADVNADGVLDVSDTVITSTTTTTTGNYSFANVTITNTLVAVTVPTNTGTFTYVLTTASTIITSSTITDITGADFGINQELAIDYNISGTVFDDDNENAVLDGREGFLANVTLSLYADNDNNGRIGAGDTIITTTTSATDGTYSFLNVVVANTLVQVAVPGNTVDYVYTLTTANQLVSSSVNTDVTGIDFGINEQTATYSISGVVFDDDNENGVRESESGLANVTVSIFNDVNQNGRVDRGEALLSQVLTDRNGNYAFAGLTDVFVVVQALLPATTATFSYTATTPLSVANNTGLTNSNVNFGINRELVVLYSVSGILWDDDNDNQIKDASELFLENIDVALYNDLNGNGIIDTVDLPIATVPTSITGAYSFTNVSVANVIVAPVLPSNGAFTTASTIALTSVNTNITNANFGINITSQLYQVTGVVFDDDNRNGVADPGEGSVNGLPVEIYVDVDGSGTLDTNIDMLVAFTVTSNGAFNFADPNYVVNDVPDGDVLIRIVIPAGNPPLLTYTATSDPGTGTVNPDGIYSTTMTSNRFGVDFGIDVVDFTTGTSRVGNGDDVLFTNNANINLTETVDVSSKLRLYPNPAVNQIAINSEEFDGDVTVEVYNDRGYKVMTTTASSFGNELKVDVQRLRPGMYYVKFGSRNKIASKKFIKR